MDSAASHNITSDLNNLSIHSEYDGTDEVVLGDGSGLTVSHIGSLTLKSKHKNFILKDTLCVPDISKNLISVHHFTAQNNVFIEFHSSHFLVKDTNSGVILAKGACENGVYIFPNTLAAALLPMVANVHEKTSLDGTNGLVILPPKLFTMLFVSFHFHSQPLKSQLYVLHVLLIKHINNLFDPLVYQALHLLISFALMFGVLFTVLV
jgi:hypothetical protein